jgi:hypothetical protein
VGARASLDGLGRSRPHRSSIAGPSKSIVLYETYIRRDTSVVQSASVSDVLFRGHRTGLGAFAKLRQATISFVMSVRLCVHMELLWLPLDEF